MDDLKKQILLLLSILNCLSTGWSQEVLPYYQPHPMLGTHILQSDFGEVSIEVSSVDRNEYPSLDTSSTYVSYYRL